MLASTLYQQLRIPPNLQRHQLQTAAVGEYVSEHWSASPQLDAELITQVLLVHDLGNIVKFQRPFLGELEQNAEYWQQVQDELRAQHGTNAHEATRALMQNVGISQRVQRVVNSMVDDGEGAVHYTSFEQRVCHFADMSVSPEGIVGFSLRKQDLCRRYPAARTRKAVELQEQNLAELQAQVSCSLTKLPTAQLESRAAQLGETRIELATEPTP